MLDSDSRSAAGRGINHGSNEDSTGAVVLGKVDRQRPHSQFAIRECRMDVMVLKPQDVYVALKIVASQADRAPYSQLAAELVMSPSEVHASVRRAEGSHLLHGPQRKNRPNFSALEEFLLHG